MYMHQGHTVPRSHMDPLGSKVTNDSRVSQHVDTGCRQGCQGHSTVELPFQPLKHLLK